MTIGRPARFSLNSLLRVLLALGLAFVPVLRSPAAVGSSSPLGSPTSPLEEEEEKRGEAKSAAEAARSDRQPRTSKVRPTGPSRSDPSAGLSATSALTRAAPLDPFRNGLGSPFRC
jgi:hypothetical protein